jgi:hypothetical protein
VKVSEQIPWLILSDWYGMLKNTEYPGDVRSFGTLRSVNWQFIYRSLGTTYGPNLQGLNSSKILLGGMFDP